MALSFVIAAVQNGMGPYVALFLQSSAHWNPAQIGERAVRVFLACAILFHFAKPAAGFLLLAFFMPETGTRARPTRTTVRAT